MSSDERCWWRIRVTGWGSLIFYGTEQEAAEKRDALADREHGTGLANERLDPSNRVHREIVEQELAGRRARREKGETEGCADDPPLLAETVVRR